jgi:hypothetical protein
MANIKTVKNNRAAKYATGKLVKAINITARMPELFSMKITLPSHCQFSVVRLYASRFSLVDI